jgi:hypothetical protein
MYEISGQAASGYIAGSSTHIGSSGSVTPTSVALSGQTGCLAFIFLLGAYSSSPTASTPSGYTRDYFSNDGTNIIAAYRSTSTVSGTVAPGAITYTGFSGNPTAILVLVAPSQAASNTATASATVQQNSTAAESASATVKATTSVTEAATATVKATASATKTASATVKATSTKTATASAAVASSPYVPENASAAVAVSGSLNETASAWIGKQAKYTLKASATIQQTSVKPVNASATVFGTGAKVTKNASAAIIAPTTQQFNASATIRVPVGLAALSTLDVRVSIFEPDMSATLALDIVSTGDFTTQYELAGGGIKYEDTPQGCGAGQLSLGLRLEEAYAKGYYSGLNIVEISTADNILQSTLCQNIVPNSDLAGSVSSGAIEWTDTSSGVLAWVLNGAQGGQQSAFQATGSGGAVNGTQYSQTMLSTVGIQMKIGGYIDATNCSGNTPRIRIMDPTRTTTYFTLNAVNGSAGPKTGLWTPTTGQTSFVYVFDANGTTLASTKKLTFALPIATTQTQLANGHYISSAAGGVAYLDTSWTFDPSTGEDAQQAYFWDGSTLTMRCPVTKVGQDATDPYIEIGQPLDGGVLIAYGAGTLVGRRRYSGRIVALDQTNDKNPNGTVTLVGMRAGLADVYDTFTVGRSAAIDASAAVYAAFSQNSGRWPYYNIQSANFPTVGSIYSGTKTNVSVEQFISDVVTTIPTGDVWVLRVGHDRTPRLMKLYSGASNSYVYNVSLDQNGLTFAPMNVEIKSEDCSGLFNALLVTGDQDPVTKQPVQAISYDANSIALLRLQIDGAPVSNLGCKSTQDCANYGLGLLNQFSIPRSNNKFTVFVRNDQSYAQDNVGRTTQGDVVRAVANTAVSGFENQPYGAGAGNPYPSINGLGVSVQTVIDFQTLDRWQEVQNSAIQPSWQAAIQERSNALANALMGNTLTGTGLDQYFVDVTAYSAVHQSGLNVSVGPFKAVFALGSSPVNVGTFPSTQSTFTCYANSLNWVWLGVSGGVPFWNVQQNNATAQTGQILYAIVQTNATSIMGLQPKAPIGLLEIPGTYLLGGVAYTPTFTNQSIATYTHQYQISQFQISFEVTNQPTDGSYQKMIFYYRQQGQPTWLQFGTDVPRDASTTLPTPGAPLQNGATSVTGNYSFIYPDASNGLTYEFGFALESFQGTETTVVSLGTANTSNGIPSGAYIGLLQFQTFSLTQFSTSNLKTNPATCFFWLNDSSNNQITSLPFVSHWQLEVAAWDGITAGVANQSQTTIISTVKATQPLSIPVGSFFYIDGQVQLNKNFSSGGKTFSYAFLVRIVAIDGSYVYYTDASMTFQA